MTHYLDFITYFITNILKYDTWITNYTWIINKKFYNILQFSKYFYYLYRQALYKVCQTNKIPVPVNLTLILIFKTQLDFVLNFGPWDCKICCKIAVMSTFNL